MVASDQLTYKSGSKDVTADKPSKLVHYTTAFGWEPAPTGQLCKFISVRNPALVLAGIFAANYVVWSN